MYSQKTIRASTITLIVIILVAISAMSVSALANFTHDTDEWNYGIRAYYIIKQQQYSEFTCYEQKHSATVRIRYEGETEYEDHRVVAVAGNLAYAHKEFLTSSSLDTRRSYYSHID